MKPRKDSARGPGATPQWSLARAMTTPSAREGAGAFRCRSRRRLGRRRLATRARATSGDGDADASTARGDSSETTERDEEEAGEDAIARDEPSSSRPRRRYVNPHAKREIMRMNDGSEREILVDGRFACAKCARGSSCYVVHKATSAVAKMRTKRRYNDGRKGRRGRGKHGRERSRARDGADPLGAATALVRDGHRPTRKTFTAVIATLGAMGRAKEALEVVPMVEEYGEEADVAVWNACAHAFCASGDPAGAEKIADRMASEDGVGVNGATHPEIIYTYAKRGELNRVYRLIRRMNSAHGVIPDERAYNAFLRGLCETDALEDAEEVLRRWNNEKFDLERQSDRGGQVSKPSAASYGLVIDGWARRGNMLAARKLLQQMQWERIVPSLPLFNMLIDGYLKQGNMGAAENMFRELVSGGTWDMESLGIKPDTVTYTLFLDHWADEGEVDACERIFKKMERENVKPDVTSFGTLVKAYARARDPDGAEAVLDRLDDARVEPSVAIYSAVVAAHCTVGDMSRARDVLDRMVDVGLRPNERTFAHFAWGYGQLEDINGIVEVARLMLANGLKLKGANRNGIVRACEECGMNMSAIRILLDRISPEVSARKGVWTRDNGAKSDAAAERGAAAKTRDDVNVDDARDDDDDDDAIVTKEIHLPRPTLETTASEDGPREVRARASRFGVSARRAPPPRPRRLILGRRPIATSLAPLRASRATAL